MAHNTPLSSDDDSSNNYFLRPFQEFFRLEASGGILLMVCTVIALAWANSPWAASYFALWQTPVNVSVGSLVINKPLLLWINDGLMAIFFFLVGLEIKREIRSGELSNPKQAALPMAAAIGGMVVPALLYTWVNWGTPEVKGWGIPMATDIAFALGVLAMLGKRVPVALKIFLTALAIVDDLGAVLVIAIFYTAKLSLTSLGIGFAFLVLSSIANMVGVRKTVIYVILGIGLWVAFLKSGVHATIAGVLLALTIPANRKLDATDFYEKANAFIQRFRSEIKPGKVEPTPDQRGAIHALEVACEHADTPLQRMEHGLHGWVAFGIMPIFALANAGVAFGGGGLGVLWSDKVAIGIILGLFFGKQIGVFLFSWLAVKANLAEMPANVSWRQLFGVGCLAGIGFTMSLFIANLAFDDPTILDNAKLGILVASILSGVWGWILLTRKSPEV